MEKKMKKKKTYSKTNYKETNNEIYLLTVVEKHFRA